MPPERPGNFWKLEGFPLPPWRAEGRHKPNWPTSDKLRPQAMSAGLASEPVNPAEERSGHLAQANRGSLQVNRSQVLVHVLAVADLDDEDHKPPALNQVDHAIVADAQPIEPFRGV